MHTDKKYKSGFSILVACKDASLRLPKTISHLSLLKTTSNFNYEVIIVSNGSSDNTVAVAKALCDEHLSHHACQVIEVSDPGKSEALDVAIKNSQYEYLLLCDDDNWLNSDYLLHSFNIMDDANIGILGGLSEFEGKAKKPRWFDKYSSNYAVGAQGAQSGEIKCVWGAGMVIRHTFYDLVLDCNYKLYCGRKTFGNYIAGEDYELCRVASYFNYKVWYDHRLVLKHYMTANRLNWNALKVLYVRNCLPSHYMTVYDYVELNLENKNILNSQSFFRAEIKSLILRFLRILPKTFVYYLTRNSEDKIHNLLYYRFIEEIKEVWFLRNRYDTIFKSILKLKEDAIVLSKKRDNI
jgi:glycosyltransferase involved in cell wall biosynthesis